MSCHATITLPARLIKIVEDRGLWKTLYYCKELSWRKKKWEKIENLEKSQGTLDTIIWADWTRNEEHFRYQLRHFEQYFKSAKILGGLIKVIIRIWAAPTSPWPNPIIEAVRRALCFEHHWTYLKTNKVIRNGKPNRHKQVLCCSLYCSKYNVHLCGKLYKGCQKREFTHFFKGHAGSYRWDDFK